jgi:hypothetical protein
MKYDKGMPDDAILTELIQSPLKSHEQPHNDDCLYCALEAYDRDNMATFLMT